MSSYLANKVVWLTGASSGIGEALAYELAEKGCKLILSARRKVELERVKGNCTPSSQENIRLLPLDVSQSSTLPLSVEAALQIFGSINILINNAGVGQRSLAKDSTMEVERNLMEVDYFGTIALTKYLLPHFLENKSGHIVVVTSVLGKIGSPFHSGYAAAKHALHGYFDSLRAELWKESREIYVTLVCPGWIRTNLGVHALTGSGQPLNLTDPAKARGLRADDFAKKMTRALEKRKQEVYIGGWKELSGVRLKRFMPGLFSRVLRTVKT